MWIASKMKDKSENRVQSDCLEELREKEKCLGMSDGYLYQHPGQLQGVRLHVILHEQVLLKQLVVARQQLQHVNFSQFSDHAGTWILFSFVYLDPVLFLKCLIFFSSCLGPCPNKEVPCRQRRLSRDVCLGIREEDAGSSPWSPPGIHDCRERVLPQHLQPGHLL